MVESLKAIDPKGVYNISQLCELGVFPWVKSLPGYRTVVMDDFFGANTLKTKISGSGRGRDYQIKGANIIKFLELKSHVKQAKGRGKGNRGSGAKSVGNGASRRGSHQDS